MRKAKPTRKTKIIDEQICSVRGVPLVRASNTMTEAQFFSFILSALRKATKFWKPKLDCLADARQPYSGSDKRIKYVYICSSCSGTFQKKDIEVDHILPIGGMNCWEKLVPWCKKAFVEKEGYQVLCSTCHSQKTSLERQSKDIDLELEQKQYSGDY